MRLFLNLAGLFLAVAAHAQFEEQGKCGYVGKSPWLEWYQRNTALHGSSENDDTAWLYVPVTLHLVGTNNGTGHFPLDQALRAMCKLNEQFNQARIRFYLMPGDAVRYHNNSNWYTHDFQAGAQMLQAIVPPLRNRLNAFVVADPAGNCGYAWYDAVVMRSGCSGPFNTTWAHEVGHHFSLPHTFSGWEGFEWNYGKAAPPFVYGRAVEKTNGSNCYTAGDGFCDTPPDYLNYRWPCDTAGRSLTEQIDPDGVPFRSDASLIMSYAYDRCAHRFSPEQIAAMRANLRTEHKAYLQFTNPLPELPDDVQVELVSPLDSTQVVQYNHIELKWKKIPGARYYVVEISRSPDFATRFYTETFIDTDHAIITKVMPNNWVLYWRVRAYSDWDLCQPFARAQIGSFRTQNLLATNDLERRATLTLKPNPTSMSRPAQFQAQVEDAMEVLLTIYDAAGRLCWQQSERLYPGENTMALPIEQLQVGAYVLAIRNELGIAIRRFVVVD
ncbi:MAG: zinc-dependent metalloprotease [Saprospiraceae bacterium]|nr:zinc-dependent metalloprotease [Saprospiraceae bacterium]MDW8483407.1 zinc-dependent metalloprotease [Saprospiraceae bacterium]